MQNQKLSSFRPPDTRWQKGATTNQSSNRLQITHHSRAITAVPSQAKTMNTIRNVSQCYLRRRLGPIARFPQTTSQPQLLLPQRTLQQSQAQSQINQQTRFISKYISKSAKKRLPLTTKRAGKGYYKGKGATKEGKLNSRAQFISDPKKKLELVVPDLEGFKVSYIVVLALCVF